MPPSPNFCIIAELFKKESNSDRDNRDPSAFLYGQKITTIYQFYFRKISKPNFN